MKNNIIMNVLIFTMTLSGASVAAADGSGSHGGDPAKAREIKIRQFIESDLRSQTLDRIKLLNVSNVKDPEVKSELEYLLAHDLASDVQNSPYILSKNCIDSNHISQPATSKSGEFRGTVCFNPSQLAAEAASENEIIALVIHENAHHFGYEDKQNKINAAVLELIQIASPVPQPPTAEPPKPIVPKDGNYLWEGDPDASQRPIFITILSQTESTTRIRFRETAGYQWVEYIFECKLSASQTSCHDVDYKKWNGYSLQHIENGGQGRITWSSPSRLRLVALGVIDYAYSID